MTAPAGNMSDFADEAPTTKKKRSGMTLTLIKVLTILAIIMVMIAFTLPAMRSAGLAVARLQCINNLKQIAMALSQYESTYGVLPPAYTVNGAGKRLHSWRTLILPYLEQQLLYETIDLSKPWNNPANAKAYAAGVSSYRCPALELPIGNTTYLAVVASDACFPPNRPRRLSEITDEPGSTLMVIEAGSDQAVHWMAPSDADESLVMRLGPDSKLDHNGGTNAAFVDGSVRFLKAQFPAALRHAMISIAGNDNSVLKNLD